MPTLNWIGKEAVGEHHKEVDFHLLRCAPALSVGELGSGNLLIHGTCLFVMPKGRDLGAIRAKLA